MTTITIQNITPEDIGEIRQLGLSTPELHVGAAEPDYYSQEMLLSFITSPHDIYLCAKVDGKLAGYFIATVNIYLKEAYLIDLVVKPEYRKLGIANLFLEKTMKNLTEKDCVWAWCLVHEENQKMMGILKKKGFLAGRKFQFFYKVKPF